MYLVSLNTEHTCSQFKFSFGDCSFYFGPEERLQVFGLFFLLKPVVLIKEHYLSPLRFFLACCDKLAFLHIIF